MTTPAHLVVDLAVFLILTQVNLINPNYADLVLLAGSNLIDLDHLFSKPIYHPKRNPFITHFLHKKWLVIMAVSVGLLFFRPMAFLGLGLLLHLFCDYVYVRREGV